MLMNLWLGVRTLAMVALFPGTVTVYIPYRILEPTDMPRLINWSTTQTIAALFVFLGAGILLACVWSFARVGKGTLAPFDETRKLVVVGLYRYMRNPMYTGVMLILLGESWFFWSTDLLIYAGVIFAIFNLLIMGYEEVRLSHKYGAEYTQYRANVGRWLPGRAYHDAT